MVPPDVIKISLTFTTPFAFIVLVSSLEVMHLYELVSCAAVVEGFEK